MPMVDWVTCELPCAHEGKLYSGQVYSVDPFGREEWSTEKALSLVGSFDSRIQLKTSGSLNGQHTHILFSGNPVKFLQGHNIFGSCDLNYLMTKTFEKLLANPLLGLRPTELDMQRIRSGHYSLSRVDINQSYHLANREEVLMWLRAAGDSARLRHRGSGLFSGETLYFGKKSRRLAFKLYSKGHELAARGHNLPQGLQIPELLQFADQCLRFEAVIRSMELKRLGLNTASAWSADSATILLKDFISRIEVTGTFMLPNDVLASLPSHLKPVYELWLRGADMRVQYSRPTFYRHRKALRQYDIDIAITRGPDLSNVVPLYRVLEAVPVSIPQWAYDKGLVA